MPDARALAALRARARRGRRTPYTERGIHRVPCLRCGAPSVHQWNICALGNLFYGVCEMCDVALNRLVLEFFDFANADAIMEHYAGSRDT